MTQSPIPEKTSRSGIQSENDPNSQGISWGSILVLALVLTLAVAMTWAGSQNGAEVWGLPVLALAVCWIFLVQLVAFIPAWTNRTEKFFDLTGSLTYISTILAALLLSGHFDATAILITVTVVAWASRLGSFLFMRVRRAGSDGRFDDIKKNFLRFLNVWMIQGLWITLTLSAALAAVTAVDRPSVGGFTIVGLLVWATGFTLEITADAQKSRFRAEPANKNEFIHTGLWSWSRHPNYFGEIILWVGVAIIAFPTLHGWQYVTLVSPFFVTILLTKVSGIPILERNADSKWSNQEDYREYKAKTSVLVPLPPKWTNSSTPRMEQELKSNKLIQPIVVTLSAIVMGIGTLAGFGLIGTRVEDSAGGVFAADATLITPDTPAFTIWSLIYVGLAAYVVWQWKERANPRAIRIGWLASASMILNAMWLGVTQLGWVWPSVVVILALAIILGMLVGRLGEEDRRSLIESVVVDGSFGVYLGWVTVASVPNVAVALITTGVDPGAPWAEITAIMVLGLAAGLGVMFAARLGARRSVAAAMSWALAWIAIGRLSGPLHSTPVALSAIVAALVIIAVTAYFFLNAKKRSTTNVRTTGDSADALSDDGSHKRTAQSPTRAEN